MNSTIWVGIINQVLIPEILAIVRRRQQANLGTTDAEVIAEFFANAADVIAEGQAWLTTHPA